MGELSGRYLKLVFPEIEPHKCVKKKTKRRNTEGIKERTDRIKDIYILLIEGSEEKKDKIDERYK